MIIADLNAARQYLPSLNTKVNNTRLNDFFEVAQREVVNRVLGQTFETVLETSVTDGEEDPHETLRTLTARAIALWGYLSAIPELDLQLSEAGFVVQSNDMMSPASQQRTDRLVASLKSRLSTAMDTLTEYLMSVSVTEQAYRSWRTTSQFKKLSRCFVPTLAIMRLNIPSGFDRVSVTWQDYYDMLGGMENHLDTLVASYISAEQIAALKATYQNGPIQSIDGLVIKEIQKAVTAAAYGDSLTARNAAMRARSLMLADKTHHFSAFESSDVYDLPTIDLGDKSVANML